MAELEKLELYDLACDEIDCRNNVEKVCSLLGHSLPCQSNISGKECCAYVPDGGGAVDEED